MSLMPRSRVRSSSIEASKVISSSCVERFRESPHTTKNATCPADANIQVNCSSMSFSNTAQTSFSH